jgi:hypothetical protein
VDVEIIFDVNGQSINNGCCHGIRWGL